MTLDLYEMVLTNKVGLAWGNRHVASVQRRLPEDGRQLFANCVLFRGLPNDERANLASRARVKDFAGGETIFLMGSPGNSMMAVLSGTVRISIPSPEGREIVLAILHPGEIFGEIALLDGKDRTADAKAISPCRLAILARNDVLAFFLRNPASWPKLVEVLCERLRRTDQQIAEVALLQVPARLAKALLRMVVPESPRKNEVSKREIRLSQRELGNFVGATRESVNKCLGEWQRSGIIRIDDNLITIVNRSALEELAE